MKTPGHKIKCCICGEVKEEWGNNARPVAKGVCCDACNRKVLLARLDAVFNTDIFSEID